jgi:3-oxoacyl-[acyl-carrier-protein] synthase-3
MRTSFSCSHVAGIAAAAPRRGVDLTAFGEIWGEDEVAKIIASTGISRIRQAPAGMTTADLCHDAAQALLASMAIDPASIDGIVFVSQTPDYIMPATSAVLQKRLGLDRRIVAFDINYGCSGYVYGLLQADMLIHAGLCRSVLVLAGDTTTTFVNPRDRALRMLFGDAGSASLVVAGDSAHCFSVCTDGSGATSLMIPAGGARQPRNETTRAEHEAENSNVRCAENLFMDGIAVLLMALRDVPEAIGDVLELAQWEKDEPRFYGLHQANRFMIDYLARKMKLPGAAAPFSCADIGNTGPASIPVLLAREHARLQDENRLEKAVLCGFGVGFSVAAMSLPLDRTRILDLVELD